MKRWDELRFGLEGSGKSLAHSKKAKSLNFSGLNLELPKLIIDKLVLAHKAHF